MKKRLITMEDHRKVHVALWQWLVDNPTDGKWDWPGWKDMDPWDRRPARCMPCLFAMRKGGSHVDKCKHCPIKEWSDATTAKLRGCFATGSCFNLWLETETDHPDRVKYAKLVRDLKWTEGGKQDA